MVIGLGYIQTNAKKNEIFLKKNSFLDYEKQIYIKDSDKEFDAKLLLRNVKMLGSNHNELNKTVIEQF